MACRPGPRQRSRGPGTMINVMTIEPRARSVIVKTRITIFPGDSKSVAGCDRSVSESFELPLKVVLKRGAVVCVGDSHLRDGDYCVVVAEVEVSLPNSPRLILLTKESSFRAHSRILLNPASLPEIT